MFSSRPTIGEIRSHGKAEADQGSGRHLLLHRPARSGIGREAPAVL